MTVPRRLYPVAPGESGRNMLHPGRAIRIALLAPDASRPPVRQLVVEATDGSFRRELPIGAGLREGPFLIFEVRVPDRTRAYRSFFDSGNPPLEMSRLPATPCRLDDDAEHDEPDPDSEGDGGGELA